MSQDKKTPILLIGCGNWGQYILRDLKELNCEVTVLCISQEAVINAQKYGADYIINKLSEIKNVAGIVVATNTSTHLEVIDSVLKYNVPIYVEKPFGLDIAHAQSIAERAGDRIFIMDKWRYHPGIVELARIAKNKQMGEIVGLQIKQLSWGSPHLDVDFIEIILPHTLTMTYEILGRLPEPITSYIVHSKDKPVSIHALMGDKPWCDYQIITNSPRYHREIILECAQGCVVLDGAYSHHLNIYRTENANKNSLGEPQKQEFTAEMPLLIEVKAFLDYIKGGKKPKSDAFFGIKIMETMQKLRNLATNHYTSNPQHLIKGLTA